MNLQHEGCGGTFLYAEYRPDISRNDIYCNKCCLYTKRKTEFLGLSDCACDDDLEELAVNMLVAASEGKLADWVSHPDYVNSDWYEFNDNDEVARILIDQGLLDHRGHLHESQITEKGKQVLESYRECPVRKEEK